MADVFCNKCGHGNPANANFCSSCGAPLAREEDHTTTVSHSPIDDPGVRSDDEPTVSIDSLGEGQGLLVVMRGPGSGSRFTLDRDIVSAGRHPESDIFLDDVTVSRRHLEIHRRHDGWIVRDTGSLNGTYLNRERIEEAPIHNGDELQIGRFRLVFLSSAPAEGS
jgi:pSer/pThr/pTyr-binding forkhead associated (FHA) protein